jgi:hypothetical protein
MACAEVPGWPERPTETAPPLAPSVLHPSPSSPNGSGAGIAAPPVAPDIPDVRRLEPLGRLPLPGVGHLGGQHHLPAQRCDGDGGWTDRGGPFCSIPEAGRVLVL